MAICFFSMYIKHLSTIINSHSITYHSFTDEPQLQMSAPYVQIFELFHSMQSCMTAMLCYVMNALATANMFNHNENKTELMLVISKRTKHLHSLPTSITIGNAQILSKQSVKNLGSTSYYICTCLYYYSNMLLLTTSSGIYSKIPDKCSKCHTCICFLFCKKMTTVTNCCLILLMM